MQDFVREKKGNGPSGRKASNQGLTFKKQIKNSVHDTVDGRNPARVDRLFIPLSTGFHTSKR